MPVDPLQSGDGNPLVPRVTQAFGFALDPAGTTALLQQTVDTAQQVVGDLHQHINQALMQPVVEAAVETAVMQRQIAEHIARPVVEAQAFIQSLHQPILSHLVNTLGATFEATAPLGVVIPQPGEEAPCPSCVAIRVAAQAGDLGPALACYRASAMPLRGSRGMDYARQLEWIIQCLPVDPGVHGAFARAVETAQNEPWPAPSILAEPSSTDRGGSGDRQAIDQAVIALESQRFAQQGQAPPPSVCVGPPPRYPDGTTGICVNGQWTHQSGAGACGVIPGIEGYVDPQIAAICHKLQTLAPEVDGWIASANALANSAVAQATAACAIAPYTQFGGIVTSVLINRAGDGATASWGAPNPPQLGGGVRNVTDTLTSVPWSQFGAVYPSWARSLCAGGSQTTTPPPPPPPNCPPPPCIPICATTAPPLPPTCKYCVWCSSENILYVLPDGQKPRSTGDKQVFCGDPAGLNLSHLVDSCKPNEQQQQQQQTSGGGLGFGNLNVAGCTEFIDSVGVSIPGNFAGLSQLIGLRDGSGKLILPPIGNDPTGVLTGIETFAIGALAQIADSIGSLLQSVIGPAACAGGNNLPLLGAATVMGLAKQYAAVPLEQFLTPNEQQRNYNCPVNLPVTSDAARAFLANNIDGATLECWVRAAGDRFPEFWRVIDAARTKLSPGEYAFLRRRNYLNAGQYRAKTRETGVTRDDDAEALYELTKQIPPPSDLVQLMVRDAADTINIDWSKEDALFPQKFRGDIEKWAGQAGVQREYMELLWRAHFGLPAPGQVAMMLHRNSRLPDGNPALVTLEMARQVLIQQDISPKWVDAFMAISFAPLTRIDARRAYEIGALDEDQLLEAYLNLGYDRENSLTLVEYNKKNVNRTFLRRSEVTLFAHGEMSERDFEQAMQQWGARPEAIDEAKVRAAIVRRSETTKMCMKAYRRRFLQGEFPRENALSLVQARGQTLEAATDIVDGWECERDSKGRLFSAAQLSRLYSDGLIDETDFVRRAVRLHWEQDDAVIMLRQLQRRLGIKQATAQQKELAQEQRAQEKLARQLRQAARTADQQRRREATDIQKARTARDLRIKRVLAAGVKFAEHSGASVDDAIVQVRAVYNAAMRDYPVTNDEVIAALSTIVADKAVNTIPLLTDALATALTTQAS